MAIDDELGLSFAVDKHGNGYVFRDRRKTPVAIYDNCRDETEVKNLYFHRRTIHHYHQPNLGSDCPKNIFGRRQRPDEIINELNRRWKL